jgi:steroid 5-alpha reductase family enzyme
MRHLLATYIPALGIVAVLAFFAPLSSFAVCNLATQSILFSAVAAIPAWRSGLMSYVDIAWPWGLVAIGVEIPIFSARLGPAALAMAVAYVAIGLRMGLPGAVHLARFRRLRGEFARYRYQRMRWEAAGWRDERVPMQLEIFIQALANASVLALPAMLAACDRDQSLPAVGLSAWAGCWLLEGLADRQKGRFAARAARRATCDIGLWRYSRHPNYFFQWLGWVALAVAATPSLLRLAAASPAPEVAILALALAGAPAFMLWTLLELTGIKPSEHYSLLRRPGYGEYQRTTNRFVPGPRRALARERSG